MVAELTKPRRIELILRQIDALPTLPALATRLLSLTSSDDAHAREVVQLVAADPALTAKVLSLCRAADKGLRDDVLTIDRAVVLLGFNAIRNAVLSLKVFEYFEGDDAPPLPEPDRPREGSDPINGDATTQARPHAVAFDRSAFWTHSLAVAMAAETIAASHRELRIPPEEAFVCGLLHDVGKLALDTVLPKAFARCVELADLQQANIAEVERKIVGLDHHTAGKRLAEQWRLPHRLQDAVWLHGSAYDTLPRLDHRRLVGLITLSDLIARRLHLGYSGNHRFQFDRDEMIRQLGLGRDEVEQAIVELPEKIAERGQALGIQGAPSREMLLGSIQQANAALGRLNAAMSQKAQVAQQQHKVLHAIGRFYANASPGRTVQDVLDAVVESAIGLFGPGFYAVVFPDEREETFTGDETGQGGEGDPREWLVSQYGPDGRLVNCQYIPAPAGAADLNRLDATEPLGMDLMGILPWLADYLVESEDLRRVRLLPMPCGWGVPGVLLHDRPELPVPRLLTPLAAAWGAAIAAAAQHEGAKRLGEELAQANSALAETQDKLLRQESLARLGEMAAGAAHEMNNPLAVISGRSQILANSLDPGTKAQQAAQTIFREAHRLSDLISSLHMLAEPPEAQREPCDLAALLHEAVRKTRDAPRRRERHVDLSLKLRDDLPLAYIDADMVATALRELLVNALQANPKTLVHVEARMLPGENTAAITVTDDGDGMDPRTLGHALDPFFSAKPAGRRVGLGLPRAQQLIQAHGGTLELRSTTGQGTVASFTLALD